jgi:hypothetical protein
MSNETMSRMLRGCCGEDGMPDLKKLKHFMQTCGKTEFSDKDIEMMTEFCSHSAKPNAEKMRQLMEACGCG